MYQFTLKGLPNFKFQDLKGIQDAYDLFYKFYYLRWTVSQKSGMAEHCSYNPLGTIAMAECSPIKRGCLGTFTKLCQRLLPKNASLKPKSIRQMELVFPSLFMIMQYLKGLCSLHSTTASIARHCLRQLPCKCTAPQFSEKKNVVYGCVTFCWKIRNDWLIHHNRSTIYAVCFVSLKRLFKELLAVPPKGWKRWGKNGSRPLCAKHALSFFFYPAKCAGQVSPASMCCSGHNSISLVFIRVGQDYSFVKSIFLYVKKTSPMLFSRTGCFCNSYHSW